MRRRVACVFLPEVRLELVRARERMREQADPAGPVAVVIARRDGAVEQERDILGNTRVDVVSAEARALGVRPGQTVAAARAKVAELRVRVVAEEEVQNELARVAEASLSFGPASGFDAAQDVVWVDVTGCDHLRGGELELARALEACVRGMGYACRIAIADGPRVAAAVARFGGARIRGSAGSQAIEPSCVLTIVPEGKSATAMRGLPVAALGLDAETTVWLRDLGLRTCGDLQRLPRRSFGTRLGDHAVDVLQLLDGDDRAPIVAWRPPEVPEERVSLDWGIGSVEALTFVLKSLCDRLGLRLERRAMAAARLELVLGLDRALCDEGKDPVTSLHVVLPSPMAHAGELLSVLCARLEGFALAAPVLMVTLRAPELARHAMHALDLIVPEPKAWRVLPRLVAELGAQLGADRVGILALVDTWTPTARTRLVPIAGGGDAQNGHGGGRRALSRRGPGHSLVTSALEPTRLAEPDRLAKGALTHVRSLARIEAVAWWRKATSVDGPGKGGDAIDLVSAWVLDDAAKHRKLEGEHGALAWVELREGDALLLGWID